MTRKVSVNKITLKGLTPNETISTVTFESDKQHSAYYVPGTGNYSPNGTKLTFTFTTNNTVPASGEFPVYFTTAPVTDATFTVKVTTNAAIYEKTGASTISFAVGSVRRFGMNLSGYRTPITAGTVYTLVESNSDIVDGADYLIVGSYNSVYKAMAAQRTNNRGASEELTIDNNTITIDNSSEAHIFTLLDYDTDGFVFQDKSDNTYLYGDGANGNYLKSDASINSSSYWTINVDASSHHAIITNNNNDNSAKPYLKYNQSGLFSCYGSSSTGTHYVYLYVSATSGGKLNSGLSFTTASYAFVLGDSNYSSFTGQTLNNPNSLTGITWASDNTSLATVSNGTVSLVANATGTATITASFAGNDTYKAGSASYTITVNAPTQSTSLPFIETFANCTGEAGWSGGAGAGTFVPDHEDWFVSSAHGANGAAKFGTGSVLGSAETPQIEYSGNATLTFKAGAWNGNSESTNLKLSVSSGSLYGDASLSIPITSVTLVKGDWTEYTVYLKDLESPFTVTFEGNAASNSRFFLDDVSIVEGIVQPAPSFGATISNTNNVEATGGSKTINVTGNVAWTVSATNGASVSPSSGAGMGSVTVTIPANTNTSSTVSYSVTVSTTATVTPNSYQFTIIQDAATAIGNDGTLEHPYTASEARALALSGDTGSYYISGTVTKIQNQFSASYGTANFWIDENGTSQTVFEAYKIKYFDNVDWVEGNAKIALNDEVIIYGTLTVYTNNNNSTPETSSGYLVSLNGKTKGLTPGMLTATPNNANKQIAVTWGAASGTTSAISYVVTCGTQTHNATAAGSHTFTMADYGIYDVTVVASASDAISGTALTSVTLSNPSGNSKTYTVEFLRANMSKGVSAYTGTSFSITDELTLDVVNFNNNNKGWDYIKAGSKNGAYTGTISTHTAIPEAIKTVILTIDAITAANVTSIKLYSSNSSSSGFTEVGSFAKSSGNQSVTIANPATNKYYKIEVVCTKGSSNGLCTLSKVVFSTD